MCWRATLNIERLVMSRTLCLFPDLHGIPRGKLISGAIETETQIGFSPGVFAKDIYGKPHLFDELATPFDAADMKMKISSGDCRPIKPTKPAFLFGAETLAIGRMETPDGRPHPFDMRRILHDFIITHRAKDEFRIGAELEFFLMDHATGGLSPDGQAYAFGGLSNRQICLTAILDALDHTGIAWRDLSQENEIDQYEISLAQTDPLEQADRVFLARLIIRYVAAQYGQRASFLAVNSMDMSPSNLHLHVSCRSVTVDNLAVAIQNTLYDAFTIYRPSANSGYSKDIASFASNRGDIADGSRFAAIRIIRKDSAPRVELRTPTSDVNPYFAILMVLAGPLLPQPSTPLGTQDFNFDLDANLERFLKSAVAAAVWTDEGRQLFKRLKTSEYEVAKAFGSFENEREALLKVI